MFLCISSLKFSALWKFSKPLHLKLLFWNSHSFKTYYCYCASKFSSREFSLEQVGRVSFTVLYNSKDLVLLVPCHRHSTPLLEKLHWLPISERIRYKVAYMCFSAISGSGPAYLSELLHVCTPSCTLRSSSDTRMLKIQHKRKTLWQALWQGFHTSSCFGPNFWNSLPQRP